MTTQAHQPSTLVSCRTLPFFISADQEIQLGVFLDVKTETEFTNCDLCSLQITVLPNDSLSNMTSHRGSTNCKKLQRQNEMKLEMEQARLALQALKVNNS